MELLADRDRGRAQLLDPVLEYVMEPCIDEGTVNQVMGDGIMASLRRAWPTRTTRCGVLRGAAMQSRSSDTPRACSVHG